MTGDKLGKQGGSGSGSQFPQSGTHPLRSKNPYSFAIWGKIAHKKMLLTVDAGLRVVNKVDYVA